MSENKNTIRTFIAIELPVHVIDSIKNVQKGIKSHGLKLRWVQPENIHLTLKFLGDIALDDVDAIGDALKDAASSFSGISLHGKRVGVFPNLRRPKVMWVGVGGEIGELLALQSRIESNLEEKGFPKEKRKFKGHLTIGRVKGSLNEDKLMSALREFSEYTSEPFAAEEFVLFKSDLKPAGAVYTRLMTIPLSCR